MRPISLVAIATADRPGTLRRALASLDASAVPDGRAVRFVVVDGSQHAANRLATRACVERAAARSGRPMYYVGQDEAKALRHRLGVPDAFSGALSPGTAGASRSLLVLLTAGEPVLFVDDDIVAETKTMGIREPGLILAGHEEHRACRFVMSRRSARAAVRRAGIPLLAAHEELLGLDLPELLVGSTGRVDIGSACPHLLSGLVDARRIVVRLTFTGVVGDTATSCPKRLLLSTDGTLLRALWSRARTFETAMRSREVVRLAPANWVTHDANCMAMCMGLANDTLSPPFLPLGRNEDGVFGALVAATDPDAAYGHLSVAVLHDSHRGSRYRAGEARSARECRLAELIIGLVQRAASDDAASPPARRFRDVGRELHDVASRPFGSFVRGVREITHDTRIREFRRAATIASQHDAPAYWRRALANYRRAYEKASASEAFCLPVEYRRHRSVAGGFRALQEFLRRFGAQLESWPELWEKARLANEPGGAPALISTAGPRRPASVRSARTRLSAGR